MILEKEVYKMSYIVKNLHRKTISITGSIVATFTLCCVIAVFLLNHPVAIRSDSAGVEFLMEADQITYVAIKGQYPYLRVICPLDEEYIQDAAGNVTEKICIYTVQAEPSFFGNSIISLRLDIEPSDEITCTYILKFSDKEVKIVNGKVVE